MLPRPAAPVAITEKLLITAGGWEAIRHARGLREAGRVSGATWSPPVVQGMVREGDREYRAGLKILSATNVENLCTCRASREYGTICAHSLAVGLAIIAGQTPVAPPPAAKSNAPGPTARVALPYQADPAAATRLHVVLAAGPGRRMGKGATARRPGNGHRRATRHVRRGRGTHVAARGPRRGRKAGGHHQGRAGWHVICGPRRVSRIARRPRRAPPSDARPLRAARRGCHPVAPATERAFSGR